MVALFRRLLLVSSLTSASQFWEIELGSKSGLLTIARILPVEGSSATTAPLRVYPASCRQLSAGQHLK